MPEWRNYENHILDELRGKFKDTVILPDQKLLGHSSKVERQIDILIKNDMVGSEMLGVVECKYFNRKVDVKAVDSFIGFLEDVQANLGIIITNVGYSAAAKNRAASKKIRLDIVAYNELDDYYFDIDYCDCGHDIHWNSEVSARLGKAHATIIQGNCNYCDEPYYKCKKCGHMDNVTYRSGEEPFECGCGNTLKIESDYIGSGMNKDIIYLVGKTKKVLFTRKKAPKILGDI